MNLHVKPSEDGGISAIVTNDDGVEFDLSQLAYNDDFKLVLVGEPPYTELALNLKLAITELDATFGVVSPTPARPDRSSFLAEIEAAGATVDES